ARALQAGRFGRAEARALQAGRFGRAEARALQAGEFGRAEARALQAGEFARAEARALHICLEATGFSPWRTPTGAKYIGGEGRRLARAEARALRICLEATGFSPWRTLPRAQHLHADGRVGLEARSREGGTDVRGQVGGRSSLHGKPAEQRQPYHTILASRVFGREIALALDLDTDDVGASDGGVVVDGCEASGHRGGALAPRCL